MKLNGIKTKDYRKMNWIFNIVIKVVDISDIFLFGLLCVRMIDTQYETIVDIRNNSV